MTGTAGIIIINDMMPKDINLPTDKPIDNKQFKKAMDMFAKKYPEKFARNISAIANIGEKMAYYLGSNVGPGDLKGNKKDTSKLIRSLESKMKKTTNVDEKRKILLGGLGSAIKLVDRFDDSNEMLQQVKSGSRGKPAQLARMAVGPIYAVDMNQLPKPILIKNNFTNGLTSQEYFNVTSQGRFSSVQAANATAEPGALGKVLIANTDDQQITTRDCGTRNGQFKNPKDRNILGMYEAGTNKLIDEAYFKTLQRKNKVQVRTPIMCKAKKGLCAMCYGLLPNGKLPDIGDNVGIRASHTLGEITTQMALSTKHSTIGKEKDESLIGISGFNTIANSPASFQSAVLSSDNGRVQGVEKNAQGGHTIYLNNKRYQVPPSLKPKIKVGETVHKGDILSTGVITPKQVLKTRSEGEAREHESDMLHKLFYDTTGKDIQKKHFDVIARGHLSLGIDRDGIVKNTSSSIMDKYPKISMKKSVSRDIIGLYLAESVGSMSKGLEIDERVFKKLKEWQVFRVDTTKERPPIKPIFKSLEQRPTFSGSLFQKVNYRNLSKAIREEILHNKKPSMVNSYSSDRAKYTAGYL